jgi:hypothetical protein
LVWVAKRLSQVQINKVVSSWVRTVNKQQVVQPEHEIFISAGSSIDPTRGVITIYQVPGIWEQQLSPDVVVKTADDLTNEVLRVGETLVIYPKVSSWYAFEQAGQILIMSVVDGIGTRRIKESADLAYFIYLQNQELVTPFPDLRANVGLTGKTSYLDAEQKMRVVIELEYLKFATAYGTSSLTAEGSFGGFCDDLLDAESFGTPDFSLLHLYDVEDFIGGASSGEDCSDASSNVTELQDGASGISYARADSLVYRYEDGYAEAFGAGRSFASPSAYISYGYGTAYSVVSIASVLGSKAYGSDGNSLGFSKVEVTGDPIPKTRVLGASSVVASSYLKRGTDGTALGAAKAISYRSSLLLTAAAVAEGVSTAIATAVVKPGEGGTSFGSSSATADSLVSSGYSSTGSASGHVVLAVSTTTVLVHGRGNALGKTTLPAVISS